MSVKLSGAESGIFHDCMVNTIAANALAPFIARTSVINHSIDCAVKAVHCSPRGKYSIHAASQC